MTDGRDRRIRATRLARKGYCVVPVHVSYDAEGKKVLYFPLGAWQNVSTSDREIVESWDWDEATHVGIDCEKSGIVAVDLDRKDGKDGVAVWDRLLNDHHTPASELRVPTPSGGFHEPYKADPASPIKSSKGSVGAGIDIRAAGGFLIAYDDHGTWSSVENLPIVPKWLAELGGAPGARHGRRLADRIELPPDDPDKGNDELYATIGGLAKHLRHDFDLFVKLARMAARDCIDPIDEATVDDMIRRIWAQDCASKEVEMQNQATIIRDLHKAVNDGKIPDLYVSGGRLTWVRDQHDDPDLPVGESRKISEPVTPTLLGALAAEHLFVYVWTKDEETDEMKQKRVQPPTGTLATVLSDGRWSGVPPLRGITRVPVLRADGSILLEPGYDAVSGLYFDPQHDFSSLSSDPTADQVAAAREFILDKLLFDLPWVDKADLANMVAAMATTPIRRFLNREGGNQPTPLHLISAGTRSTGKSLVSDIITLPYGSVMRPWTENEEELRKAITTMLGDQTKACCVFDNVPSGHQIRSANLSMLLTSSVWTDRLLGKNTQASYVNDRLWIATGNNPRLGGDNASRTVGIRLDARMERPELRDGFKIPKLSTLIQQSGFQAQVVTAILTLLRAWIADGAPEIHTPMRNYTGWSSVMAGFLAHHDIHGFMDNAEAIRETDTDESSWAAFLGRVHESWPDGKQFRVTELARKVAMWDDAGLWAMDPNRKGQTLTEQRIGHNLKGKVGVITAGLVLRQTRTSATKPWNYYVERVTP